MAAATLDLFPEVLPEGGRSVESLVILLHGYGANGWDLLDLARMWSQVLPNTAWLSPHAPEALEGAPQSDYPQEAYQWFSLMDINPERRLSRTAEVAPVLSEYLHRAMAHYGLAPHQVVLGGFSQGCMMSLYTALREPLPLAGVLGFSGRFPHQPEWDDAIQSRPRTLLLHGEADSVIPVSDFVQSRRELARLDVPLFAQSEPGLGHGISQTGLKLGQSFLSYCLNPDSPSDLSGWQPQAVVGG